MLPTLRAIRVASILDADRLAAELEQRLAYDPSPEAPDLELPAPDPDLYDQGRVVPGLILRTPRAVQAHSLRLGDIEHELPLMAYKIAVQLADHSQLIELDNGEVLQNATIEDHRSLHPGSIEPASIEAEQFCEIVTRFVRPRLTLQDRHSAAFDVLSSPYLLPLVWPELQTLFDLETLILEEGLRLLETMSSATLRKQILLDTNVPHNHAMALVATAEVGFTAVHSRPLDFEKAKITHDLKEAIQDARMSHDVTRRIQGLATLAKVLGVTRPENNPLDSLDGEGLEIVRTTSASEPLLLDDGDDDDL